MAITEHDIALVMLPAHSVEEATSKAKELLGKRNVTVTAVSDGVSVVAEP